MIPGVTPLEARIGGTGLGLSLVKHIAEAHGGSVWSSVGHGSTFTLRLPAHDPRQETM